MLILTGVRVSPVAMNAATGGTFTFTAEVDGMTDQTVTWTIVEETSAGTFINANGILVVAPDEALTSLTVRATSGMDNSISGTSAVTVTIVPTVSSVSVVNPTAPVSLAPGESRSFSAAVSGYYDPDETVTWSIDETDKHEGTTIDADGYLTVSPEETLTSITVRATSEADKNKSGAVVVQIAAPVAAAPDASVYTIAHILPYSPLFHG